MQGFVLQLSTSDSFEQDVAPFLPRFVRDVRYVALASTFCLTLVIERRRMSTFGHL